MEFFVSPFNSLCFYYPEPSLPKALWEKTWAGLEDDPNTIQKPYVLKILLYFTCCTLTMFWGKAS